MSLDGLSLYKNKLLNDKSKKLLDRCQMIESQNANEINYNILTLLEMDKKIDDYYVSEQQKETYNKNGHICLRKIIKEEDFAQFRQDMNFAIQKVNSQNDKQQRIDDYSSIFTQVTNIWRVNPQTSEFILNNHFAKIAAQLLQVPKVRLYHDQALVKYPKAGKTPWHQDYFYWPVDSPRTITMWLPLHNCPRNMGTMLFASGSHIDETLDPQPIREGSQEYYEKIISEKKFNIETYDLQAGDATFHSGRTIHCAHPNGQLGKREVITIIYFEDGAKAMPENKLNQFRKVDLKVFCPGVLPQHKIDSELNPILN